MAQTFPTSAGVIYDALVNDATFMAKIGTYSFTANGGSTTPAISILSPGEDLPSIRNVSGLECVIHDAANVQRKDYLTDLSDPVYTWQLFLICWEGATGDDMTAASTQIVRRFGGATSTETVAVSDGLGALVQTRVLIPSDRPIIG